MRVRENHDLADGPLLGPSGDDGVGPFRADAGYLPQTAGIGLNYLEDLCLEGRHELFGIDWTDAADHAGSEISFDALDGGRRHGLEEAGTELDAMGGVVAPFAARLDEFAGRDGGSVADDRDEIALAAGLDAQHAITVVGIVEGHPLDEAGEDFRGVRGFSQNPSCHVPGSVSPHGRLARNLDLDPVISVPWAPAHRSSIW